MRISDWSSDVCSSDLADALFLTDLGEFPGDFRGGGGVVDEDRALAHPGEGAVVAEDDAAQVVVVADATEHQIGARGGLARRRRRLAAMLLRPFLGLRRRTVVDGDLVAAQIGRASCRERGCKSA